MFSPSRFMVARRRRGQNKTGVARGIGVDLRSITAYEKGEFPPSPENLEQIAIFLDFPVSFFSGDDIEVPSASSASFRSLAKMTAAKRDAALGAGAITFLLNDWIEEHFELPKVNLPDLGEAEPEVAAAMLRQHWGLGEQSVRNMVHLLEAKGVRVYSLAEEAAEVDAFSLWRDQTPFIFLNTLKSAERSRFDAAHELGHLVLHRHGAICGREAEREANSFASAFLMPRGSILSISSRMFSLAQLIELKKNWIVSVAALTYRLHTVGYISEWHYRTLFIEMAKCGYRTNEPESAPREISQILARVFSALRDDGISKSDIAAQLRINTIELNRMVFGLILLGLEGGVTEEPKSPDDGSHLRVVK